jgi:hypothetical protein
VTGIEEGEAAAVVANASGEDAVVTVCAAAGAGAVAESLVEEQPVARVRRSNPAVDTPMTADSVPSAFRRL